MPPLAATGATPGSIKLKLGYDHNSVVQLGNQTMAQVILFRHNLREGELISSPQSERKEPQGRTILILLEKFTDTGISERILLIVVLIELIWTM